MLKSTLIDSILIGRSSVYRYLLIMITYEASLNLFKLLGLIVSGIYWITSKISLKKFMITFKTAFLVFLFGVPLLGLPFELACLLAICKYSISRKDSGQLHLMLVYLPLIAIKLVIWIRHSGWEFSYSIGNHVVALLYTTVLSTGEDLNDFPNHLKQWYSLSSSALAGICILIGWQHPYITYELCHLWTALLLLFHLRYKLKVKNV